MKSVISEMLSGEMYRAENAKRSDKFKEMQKSSVAIYEKFLNTLNDKQKTMFEEVLDCLFELNDNITKKDFEEGFKLGLRVAFEAIE